MADRNLGFLTNLANLPDVPLDKIISCLSADDLRAFHQVSKGWKAALENRKRSNDRRLELVERIIDNQENISRRSFTQEPTPTSVAHRVVRERTSDFDAKKDDDSPILMECTNLLNATPTSVSYVPTPDFSGFLTPNSRFEFQEFDEAEKKLQPGQRLFKCRRCRGPVPSPPPPPVNLGEPRRCRTPESTRCNLVSRIQAYPGSPQKREFKKAKTLSTADLSPIPYSAPVTVASLGEKMSHSLVLSSPCLSTSTVSHHHLLLDSQGCSPNIDLKRSTSCSSITGIDLPARKTGDHDDDSINLSLNLSMSNFNSPSSPLDTSRLMPEQSTFALSCNRSCCVRTNMHASHLSDSNLSFSSEPNNLEMYVFANIIPSPVPVPKFDGESHNSNYNIERVRDFQDFSNSDGALSVSSFQFQRSIHGDNTSSFSELNPVLECPNPQCRHRFCSGCEETEHPGKACHVLSSDNFESFQETESYVESSINNCSTSINSNPERPRDNSNRKKSKSKQKKSLRRIAKGP